MPYFIRGLLVVLAFVVTRIVHLIRKHRKDTQHSPEEKHNKEKHNKKK